MKSQMTEKKYDLTNQQVAEAFINANLEEDYNFLQRDLTKLAQAFIDAAKPAFIQEERNQCINFVRSLNTLVADKLQEYREGK